MSEEYFCLGCNRALDAGDLVQHEEADVNWREWRCPNCECSELEEINWSWALEQAKAALVVAKRSYSTSRAANVARLEYAIDFFEGEEP